ncbi:MAG TPA: nucleotide exchange factor GrpE [Porphyromonadaceae bacterium]|nr:nucleotide exchange factor GrpE [Porphyromonadaceae bacterium]
MSKKDKNKEMKQQRQAAAQEPAAAPEAPTGQVEEQQAEQAPAEPTREERIAELEAALEKEKKEYLFLMADFDNFRKRTRQEKMDLLKNGAEGAMRELLPVVDDFERALESIAHSDDVESLKEGVTLIYNKFVKYLEQQHVTAIESTGKDFDADLHEAVTMFPAPDESMRGKVIDTPTKGYMINDKVLRHAKVVVGQ